LEAARRVAALARSKPSKQTITRAGVSTICRYNDALQYFALAPLAAGANADQNGFDKRGVSLFVCFILTWNCALLSVSRAE
jgi:hypothetical protein